MPGLGIMILIQDWAKSPFSSIHLLESDIPLFAKETGDTPIGAPEIREAQSDRVISQLSQHPVGVWLDKERTRIWP